MNLFQTNEGEAFQKRRLRLFEKSWMQQEKLQTLSEMLGSVRERQVLDLGSLGGLLGHFSREQNLNWMCADFTADGVQRIERLAGEPVAAVDELNWPFENQQMDVLILSERLAGSADPRGLMEEGHRVLKEDGTLVILTAHRSRPRKQAGGHTESELFELIRDGFDVLESRAFVRGLSFRLHKWIERRLAGIGTSWEDICEHDEKTDAAYRLLSRTYPLCWLASKLDRLMMLSPGRYLIVTARRRRVWRSRAAPRLRDGRSIADATINTRIGSAAEF